MSFAIIETGSKQYKVAEGGKLKIEHTEGDAGAKINFDKVLLVADGTNVAVGAPYVAGRVVEAEVVRQGRAKKVIVFKFHSKTRQKRKKGHRQDFTEVVVKAIK